MQSEIVEDKPETLEATEPFEGFGDGWFICAGSLLVALKLVGLVDISWVFALLPFWIFNAVCASAIAAIYALTFVGATIEVAYKVVNSTYSLAARTFARKD